MQEPNGGRSVKFGIFDHVDDAGVPTAQLYAERLRLAELYDRAGFYAYHLAEHHSTPLSNAPSPNVFLAAMAERTRRLRLVPTVHVLPMYHPVRLIEEVCMLDQLSGGRTGLGVGKGISPVELAVFEVDPETATERFDEALEILLAGLTSDVLTYEGRFYSFHRVPMTLKPLQRPHPPLWVGLSRPERSAWAAARGMNALALMPSRVVREITDRYRAEWQAQGKPLALLPLLGAVRNLVLARDGAEAMRIARRAYRSWRASLVHLWLEHGYRDPFEGILPADFEEWHAAGRAYAGTTAGAREFVAKEIEEAGITYFCADLVFGCMTYEEAAASVELFAAEVMPAFADRSSH